MNSLIKIEVNERYEQLVSARELHEKLGIEKRFSAWWEQQVARMGLVENQDYCTSRYTNSNNQEFIDYVLPIDMGKHLCMISGGEMAGKIRNYFIQVERAWNSPEQVMARALQISNRMIEASNKKILYLQESVQEKEQTIQHQAPKVLFADAVATSKSSVLVGELAKILKQNGVEIGQNRLFGWLRDEGYLCKVGENYNLPTQYSMKLGLFEIKKTTINNPDGSSFVTRTTKTTGKGQIYFVNKFLPSGQQQ